MSSGETRGDYPVDPGAILSALGDGLFVLDADGVVRHINAEAEHILGVPRQQVLGTPFDQWVSEADLMALVGVHSALGSFTEHDVSIVLKSASETHRAVNATSKPLLFGDDPERHGYVLICRELSSMQEMLSEENRRATAEAERADLEARARDAAEVREREQRELGQKRKMEAIGQLAAGIAHEINTPIQFIGDNVDFVRTTFDDVLRAYARIQQLLTEGKPGEEAKALASIGEALEEADMEYVSEELPPAFQQTMDGVHRVAKIVAAMKNFSHPDNGVRRATDLRDAIETTVTVATNEWKHVATMDLQISDEVPLVPCFADELKQVLLNLIVNASHAIADVAGDDLGTITVGTGIKGDCAEIWVRDTGSGIEDSVREKVFDPFFTTKEVGKGTGQGLALAHHVVVDKHGGEILLDTAVGKGSTFTLRLPLEAPANDTEAAEDVSAAE